MNDREPRGPGGTVLRALLVAAAVTGVFLGVRHGAFLSWDDDINLTLNPHLDPTWENVRWMFTDADHMRRYVPLAWLGWSVERACFGLTAASAHLGNLLFHAANGVLLFLVLRRLLGAAREGSLEPRGEWAAAAAASLWALHPLRVEVVAWASGRLYVQAICLLLLAMLAYLRSLDLPEEGRRPWRLAALVAYLASLLTYPLALAFPVVLVVLDGWVLGRLGPAAGGWWSLAARRVWREKLPFLLVALAVLAVSLLARVHAGGLWEPTPSLAEVGLGTRAMRAFYLWGYFVWKPLLPLGLAPVYTTLVWFDPAGAPFVLSLVGVTLATLVLGWRRRVWPGAWALWLCHLALLVPMLGLTERVHYPSDRYGYLPGLVGAAALAVLLRSLRPRLALVSALPALLACALLSLAQIGIWRDSESLFRHLLSVVEDRRYRDDLAFRLAEVLRLAGRAEDAAAAYRESLAAGPAGALAPDAHAALARWAADRGAMNEVRFHYEQALALRRGDAQLYLEAGRILLGAGAPSDAVRILRSGVVALPERGALRHDLAKALLQAGDVPGAVGEAEHAVRLLPRSPAAHRLLGAALQAAGRTREAAAALAAAAGLERKSGPETESLRAGR